MKPGYKQTEVGVIPEDWENLALEQICSVGSVRINPVNEANQHICIELEHLDSGTGKLLGYTNTSHTLSQKNLFKKGDVLFGKLRPYLKKYWFADFDGVCSTEIWVLSGNQTIENKYLFQLMQSDKVVLAANLSTGTKMPRAEWKIVKKTTLPIPPLPEQRAIAQALSDVDALLAAQEQLIAKKRDLKQATMQQLLTGKTRLPGFSGEWKVKKMEHAGSCLRGVSYRGDDDLSPNDTEYTKRLLRSNNVQNAFVVTDEVQFVNDKRVSKIQILQKNDILICMANGSKALVGKAGLFSIDDGFDYTFGAFMGCFRTDASIADPFFVFSLFQTGRYRDYISNLLAGSSINNLSPSSINSLDFSFPPYHEQVAIGLVLKEIDAELSTLEARRDKTRQIKQAMMQELLTGKTRLV